MLRDRHALPGAAAAAQGLRALRASLGALSIEEVIVSGLHEFLDQVQRRLIAATDDLSTAYFGAANSQTQS